MLKGEDDQLPARGAAMARFATTLTARPWSITPEHGAELAAQGLDAEAIEAVIGVVAVFNYLTRVADASGIEFDYDSPLPAFQPERDRAAVSRPERESWPVIEPGRRTLDRLPELSAAWRRWHEYVLDSDEPLTRRERGVLARTAAQECCDRWQADELAEFAPRGDTESLLAAFARRLSRQPWRMGPADLQALRDAGYPERAVLHVISAVALQNAESRVAMGRALLGG